MWGERCIELDKGTELWCADQDTYKGHSDVILPVLERDSGKWFVYTCRESEIENCPRVALYNSQGNRVWGKVDNGHMDMGWVARLGDEGISAMAIRIGDKSCGPDGRHHTGREIFAYDALNGTEYSLPFDAYGTIPVDLNGDGRHEIVRGLPVGDNPGEVLDRFGNNVGTVPGYVAMARKFADLPGEQMLVYNSQGVVSLIGDKNAEDSQSAKNRYSSPFYRTCREGGILLGGL